MTSRTSRDSLRIALKFVSQADTRATLASEGVAPTAPVVTADWETPFSVVRAAVTSRCASSDKAIVVVVRGDEPHLLLASMQEFVDRFQIASTAIGDDSEMGMLVDALDREKRSFSLDSVSPGPASSSFSLRSLTPA